MDSSCSAPRDRGSLKSCAYYCMALRRLKLEWRNAESSARDADRFRRRAHGNPAKIKLRCYHFLDEGFLGETRNAGTWPPPLVTLASPVALSRVR
jgi:hypothetical protein